MRRALILPLLFASPAFAQTTKPETTAPMTKFAYPETRRVEVVDEQFGVKVADPYRWLENDVRNDKEVAAWVEAENKVTDAYLATLPGRDAFKARIKQLFDYERYGVPEQKGGHYFYAHNSGLQNQAVLFVRDGLSGEGRVLIDPNGWSKDGATALAEWLPSEDGKLLAYSIQDGGTDWRTIKVLDVATGKDTGDTVSWAKFTMGVSWAKDGSGFFYSRYPEPAADAKFQALNENHRVYFHKLGTPQSADRLVYETPAAPRQSHGAVVTDDGRYLVILTSEGTDNKNLVHIVDLKDPAWKAKTVIGTLANDWSPIGNVGTKFWFATDANAPAAHRHHRPRRSVAHPARGGARAEGDAGRPVDRRGSADPQLYGRCRHRGASLHAGRQARRQGGAAGDRHRQRLWRAPA